MSKLLTRLKLFIVKQMRETGKEASEPRLSKYYWINYGPKHFDQLVYNMYEVY